MRSGFNPLSNKLISTELVFDTNSVTSQVQRISPSPEEAAHAEAVATADALLDSIDIPLPTFDASTVTSSEAGSSADEAVFPNHKSGVPVATRRSNRQLN